MAATFRPGDRVRIVGHYGFADGVVGTISGTLRMVPDPASPPAVEWIDGCRTVQSRRGPIRMYFVEFDCPHDDGSGDGPYRGSEIAEHYLVALVERRPC